MAVNLLQTLVLRGVSVLRDGQAVELCLGASEAAVSTPEVRISMRHPSLGYPQASFNSNADWPIHDAKRDVGKASFGAGRSRSRAGVPSRRSPAPSAGRTTPCGWSTPVRAQAHSVRAAMAIAGRREEQARWSPEKLCPRTMGLPATVATSLTGAIVLASTRGIGVDS
jgi:hypothetical protein